MATSIEIARLRLSSGRVVTLIKHFEASILPGTQRYITLSWDLITRDAEGYAVEVREYLPQMEYAARNAMADLMLMDGVH
jgi:hypothetical protein